MGGIRGRGDFRQLQPFAQFLARHHVPRTIEEHRENLKRLSLKPNPDALLTQFAGTQVHLENAKTEVDACLTIFWHGNLHID